MEQILKNVGRAQSPVDGEDWPALDKEYKATKKEDGLGGKANLEASGKMLDALEFRNTREGIDIGFFNSQAWKADGHVKFSGEKNNTPQRRFLPAAGQEFRPEITKRIEEIILDSRVGMEQFSKKDLQGLETKADLYAYFGEKLDLESRTEIKMAILRNEDLAAQLEDLGLLELL